MRRTRRQHRWLDDAAEQARAFLASAPSCCTEQGFVCIIQSGNLVKIGKVHKGTAEDLAMRLKALQASMPSKLELIALGRGFRFEGTFHTWFDGSRRHGEWFTASTVIRWLRKWKFDHCLCCELAWRPANE